MFRFFTGSDTPSSRFGKRGISQGSAMNAPSTSVTRWLVPALALSVLGACAEDMTDSAESTSVEMRTTQGALTFVPPTTADLSGGVFGEYYDNMDFTNRALSRIDSAINFEWGNGSPHHTMGANTFSVVWTGYLEPPQTGTYTFRTTSDDGSDLYIDGVRIVDNWGDHGRRSRQGSVNLVAGERYRFESRFYENGGGALMHVDVSVNGGGFAPVPSDWFSFQGNGSGLYARWWNTRGDFEAGEDPVTVTTKQSAVFSNVAIPSMPPTVLVGSDPPAGVAQDQFAARLSGYLDPPVSGAYEFGVDCPTSFVMWIDNSATTGVDPFVLNRWDTASTGDETVNIQLTAGDRVGFRFDYLDAEGVSHCRVGWRRPLATGGQTADFEYIPSHYFYPAALGDGTGLSASYFDNRDFTNLVAQRVDRTVDFEFGNAAPTFPGGFAMGSDNFSIQWSGEVEPLYTEQYTFHVSHDDGVQLWVNDVLIINRTGGGSFESSGSIALTAGERVKIRLEYQEQTHGAHVQLGWSSASQFRQIVPQSQLYPEEADARAGSGLEGHYYNEEGFTDFYAMRIDPMVNYNWGNASPMPGTGLGADTFSVRWLGQVRPRYTEEYTFETITNDGVRLWVNGQLLIDQFGTQSTTSRTGTIELIAGKRYDLQMDYFDRSGTAVAKLRWSSDNQADEIIPTNRLYPPPELGAGEGLLGEYYGVPNLDDPELRLVRIDPYIAFQHTDQPIVPDVPSDDYSVRWSGTFESVYEEDYTLSVRTNGGVRLYVDGTLAIDAWDDPGDTVVEHDVLFPMTPGFLQEVQLEYVQEDASGLIEFYWESESQLRQYVPMRQMYPSEPTARIEFGQCESVIEITEFDPVDGGALPDGLVTLDDGGLTLSGEVIRSPDLWVANTDDDTVTRINTTNGAVVGTYPVGYDPSRTAVDLNYDVWVANRAFGQMGSVTKLTADCACAGPYSICSECVEATVELGHNSVPRGLAIDGENNAWVGTYNTRQLYKISPSGDLLGQFSVASRPYGLAIDREGKVWIAEIGGSIECFDTVTETSCGRFTNWNENFVRGEGTNCLSPYGIAVDNDMNIWFGNWNCDGLGRLDRATYEASVTANSDPFGNTVDYSSVRPRIDFYSYGGDASSSISLQTRGVAVDASGIVWVASSSSHRLMQYDPEANNWIGSYTASGSPIGVGISDEGAAIAVSRRGASGGYGQAWSYSPDGQLEWVQSTGYGAYSYSDMTGFQLRNFTAPQGTWNRVIDCSEVAAPGCVFDYMTWDAIVPNGTQVQVRLRVGDRDPETNEPIWGEWSPTFSATPSPLGSDGYAGQFVEVEVTLISSPTGYAPTLHGVQLWRCPRIHAPNFLDLDSRWIEDAASRNYGISWQIIDNSWPETRWEFLDTDGNVRCALDSQSSITKGTHYSGEEPFPACVELNHLSNVPITRSVRAAHLNETTGEWRRSAPSDSVTYYTLVNNPSSANGDMRLLGQTGDSVHVNWCRPTNNWSAGLTGARVRRWTDSGSGPEGVTTIADFPTDASAIGTERGYAATTECGTVVDSGLNSGTTYYYSLEYQNGDGVVSDPLVLTIDTFGGPCCDTLPQGCEGVCVFAVWGPTGCELPDTYEDPEATCDLLDNDCDGEVDEDLTNACGYCGEAPAEVCDGIDNDCDGSIDVNPVDGPTYYWDGDGDGWGDDGIQSVRCAPGDGWVAQGGDCDDDDAAINPGATEICDGVDNNCNGEIDENGAEVAFYHDSDNDGFGDPLAQTMACVAPPGYTADNTDCDDTRDNVYPGAPEICDGLDNDCNGDIDEGYANVSVDIIAVRTTAETGADICDNAYDGEACEGAIAVEFEVINPSVFDVTTDIEADFRLGTHDGPRVAAPIPLTRGVDAGETESFVFCFGMEHAATADLWVGLHNLDDELPACGDQSDIAEDVNFTGGEEICDGIDNDCDGFVDDNTCGVTRVCVQTLDLTYACVAAMTEEGDCEGDDCVVTCEADADCGDDAECRSGTCVSTDEIAAATPEETTPAAEPAASETVAPGSEEPGQAGCAVASGRTGTSAGWAGTLLALMMIRRRRCRGADRS